MTSCVHNLRVPLLENDPYQNRHSFKLKEAQEVCYEGRKYRILIYENRHHLGWQFLKGAQALLATVFTLFIGLAFKGVQNLWSQALSGKEIRIVKLAENSPEAKAFEKAHPPQGLATTGGMENAGGSCYVGAILQCAKNLPSFWNLLQESHPLTRKEDETVETFQLRLQIRQMLLNILTTSKAGKLVSAKEMHALRQLLNLHSPQAIPLESPNDPRLFWLVICQILQSPLISTIDDQDPLSIHIDHGYHLPIPYAGEFFKYLSTIKLDVPPLILPATPLVCRNSIEPASEIELNCRGGLVRYRLAAFVQGFGHVTAYLKDKGTGGWVKFDDAKVTPLSHLPEEAKQNINLFFYEKC